MRPIVEPRRRGGGRRSANPIRLLLVAGIAGSVALGGLYLYASKVASRGVALQPGPIVEPPRTSLLSARRTPTVLSVTMRTGRVVRAIQSFVPAVPVGGCLSVSWKGQVIAEKAVTEPLVPASTMKVLTASAALEVLGKDHVFETAVHGTIDGSGGVASLYLVGGGDPVLVSADYPPTERYPTMSGTSLEQLADAIVAAGVKSVGTIIGVDNRYDAERYVAQWDPSLRGVEGGPIGALLVNDGVVVGETVKRDDPAIAAAVQFAKLLKQRAVAVQADPRHDVLPADTPRIAAVQSQPLPAILAEMLTNSDNNTAELLLKEMGLAKKNSGSTAAGSGVVAEVLKSRGLEPGSVVVDGSGLSRENRISCATLTAILLREVGSFPEMMAVAGVSGTLREALQEENIKGRLSGKTGTLSDVKALAGYVATGADEPVVFAMILNKSGIDDRSAYRPLWRSLGDALSRAKGEPTPDQLLP